MKRRNFIKAIGSALAALPFAGLARKTQAKIQVPLNEFTPPHLQILDGTPFNIVSQEIRADRQIADIIISDLNHAWDRADDATKEAAMLQADQILKK
jgi:hypothetical protein